MELHEEEAQERYLVSVTRKEGDALAFHETFEKLHTTFLEAAKAKTE